MVGRFDRMKQGSLGRLGRRSDIPPISWARVSKNRYPGIRASIVAEKPVNAGGAKGRREMEP